MCVYICVCTNDTHKNVRTHIYTCAHTHTYIHIYAYTDTHIYTHTYICICLSLGIGTKSLKIEWKIKWMTRKISKTQLK